MLGDKSTVELDVNHMMIGLFVLGIVVGLTTGVIATNITKQSPEAPDDTNKDTIDISQIETEGEPVLGDENAPVTIFMFEDYECPFCEKFENGAYPKIVNNYVDSGQVKIIWKDFPLSRIHPWADDSAVAMECVYREGGNDAFWPVKDKIFDNQASINTNNVNDRIVGWAGEEGVNQTAVRTCIQESDASSEVNSDLREGQSLGVSGTPTTFVGDRKLVGAQPFNRFKAVIDSKLN